MHIQEMNVKNQVYNYDLSLRLSLHYQGLIENIKEHEGKNIWLLTIIY